MPKKSHRSKAKHRAKLARTARERSSQQVVSTVAESGALARKKVPEGQVFVDRYQYVMPELRRIGILGGVMILILITLSFILG
ncbi:MAG: hypothetical protein KAI09_03315 [Dehalococcoidales bacterium]|jgi:hypothetical protein|nr:hypothetical protein [Dehalococcoidales bacterium]